MVLCGDCNAGAGVELEKRKRDTSCVSRIPAGRGQCCDIGSPEEAIEYHWGGMETEIERPPERGSI